MPLLRLDGLLIRVLQHDLVTIEGSARLDRNLATVYLAGLARSSRDTMRQVLDVITQILSDGAADYLAMLKSPDALFPKGHLVDCAIGDQFDQRPTGIDRSPTACGWVVVAAWSGAGCIDIKRTVAPGHPLGYRGGFGSSHVRLCHPAHQRSPGHGRSARVARSDMYH